MMDSNLYQTLLTRWISRMQPHQDVGFAVVDEIALLVPKPFRHLGGNIENHPQNSPVECLRKEVAWHSRYLSRKPDLLRGHASYLMETARDSSFSTQD